MESSFLRRNLMKLRKFGRDYDDFPSMIQNVACLLNVVTIDIYKNSNKGSHLFFYMITSLTGSCYFYVYIFSLVWQICFRYYGADELETIAVVMSVSLCSVTCLTKFIFMKIYAKEIKNVIDKFLKCDAQVVSNTRFAKTLRTKLRVVKTRASAIWMFIVLDGIIYVLIPFIRPGRHLPLDVYLFYGLEPTFDSPNYELAATISTLSITFGVYTMVGIATYIIVVVGYNEAQLYSLSIELENIWSDSEKFYIHIKSKILHKRHAADIKDQIMNEFIRVRLRDIIRFHTSNINLLQELDSEFRPTLALDYGIMTLSLITELLGGLENTYLQVPYSVAQVFMDCLAGQRLIDACEVFENSLYACQWEKFNLTNQKTVYLMLMMSQKTLMLTAGGIIKLNFDCLMMIFRSTYSAYTALQSVV